MIVLVGCGKMGGAMLAGWLADGLPAEEAIVVEPHSSSALPKGVRRYATAADLPADLAPDVIVFAVKPQVMPDIVPAYARFVCEAPAPVFLSVAAGRTIPFFRSHLGEKAAVIRAMPNTPAAVRRGITVLCAGPGVSDQHKEDAATLLAAVGEVDWIEDEALIDVVTAVSGSGPAYAFLLVEAMAAAGVQNGLPPDLAQRLARQTVAGAGEMLFQLPDEAAVLRRNVTSPGGTTAAALDVLMAEGTGFGPLLEKAVTAATERGRQLGG